MTSSSALTLKRSQNQSTAISDDAIVSNMKSCKSCRVWGEERSVFVFIPVWWHTLRDLVVHGDTKLRKRILRLLVPICQLVGQPTWVSQTVHPLSVNNRCRPWCTLPHQTSHPQWHRRSLPACHWSQRKDQCRKWSRPSVNFSTVTTIHDFCANGKCLCHYYYWHIFLTFYTKTNCWHIRAYELVTFKNARIYDN